MHTYLGGPVLGLEVAERPQDCRQGSQREAGNLLWGQCTQIPYSIYMVGREQLLHEKREEQ